MLFKYLNVCALTYQFFRMDCMQRNHCFISLALCDVLLYPFLSVASSGRDGKMGIWNWDYIHSLCSVIISFLQETKAGEEMHSLFARALTFSGTNISGGWSGLKVAEPSWRKCSYILTGKAELGFCLIISSMCLVISSNKGHFFWGGGSAQI